MKQPYQQQATRFGVSLLILLGTLLASGGVLAQAGNGAGSDSSDALAGVSAAQAVAAIQALIPPTTSSASVGGDLEEHDTLSLEEGGVKLLVQRRFLGTGQTTRTVYRAAFKDLDFGNIDSTYSSLTVRCKLNPVSHLLIPCVHTTFDNDEKHVDGTDFDDLDQLWQHDRPEAGGGRL